MKDIDKIIEKYFDGDTSLHEEETLRQYFQRTDIEDRHKQYAPMFNFFSEEREAAMPQKEVRKKKRFLFYLSTGIAAGIMLLIGVRLAYTPYENTSEKSMVYIDGEKMSDINTINSQALISIKTVSGMDTETLDSQIGILDSFTD